MNLDANDSFSSFHGDQIQFSEIFISVLFQICDVRDFRNQQGNYTVLSSNGASIIDYKLVPIMIANHFNNVEVLTFSLGTNFFF